MSKNFTFQVPIPHDQGFIGRSCSNPDCRRYFKISHESITDHMYCPYCAQQYHKSDFMTQEQNDYINQYARGKALEYAHNEIRKMFSRTFSGSKHVKFKPGRPYRAKPVIPQYSERELDTQLECPTCKCKFQVDGIFGYCPGCKTENLSIYGANLTIIKNEIKNSNETNRALRHAYADLVSTFEIFCKQKSALLTTETTRFQMLFETRKFFKKHLSIDIFMDLNQNEILTLRRIFQKRHLYEHDKGIINVKYIKEIPEDKNLLGQKAKLDINEFEMGAESLRKIIDSLIIIMNKTI